ncbi:MAG: U32 family peptidase [Minisyncoccia bacterium]
MKNPELLAPAGDYQCFLAAINAGANAVYFGGKNFSARNLAVNFTNKEISSAIDYAHLRGVKCYITLNTLIKDGEIREVFEFINFLYERGADALIIQDLGVLNLCKKYWPDLPLHASTQMTAHNLSDALKLKEMGFRRVVLSRELTLEEIKEIKEKSGIEIECFVHGALCYSYSGQCLFSSTIGSRSGNRGRCAQPCRRKYVLFDRENNKNLDEEGYLLSTRDLCSLDLINDLNFIDSVKIEGRMKGVEYVGGVVEKYRKYIDSSGSKRELELFADKMELASIFNRGNFCSGYFLEKKPADLISKERSKNFGVLAGEVVEARNGLIKVKVEGVKVNDGLEIWSKGGQEENAGFRVPKIKDGIIEMRLNGDIEVGDPVYKTFDYDLNVKLGKFSKEIYPGKIPARMYFEARRGKNMVLKINEAVAKGEKPEEAVNIKTSAETIKQQLEKVGGTLFFAEKIEIVIDEGLKISHKDINSLRRSGISELEKRMASSYRREKKAWKEKGAGEIKEAGSSRSQKICVQSDDIGILENLMDKGISRIYTALYLNINKFHKKGIEVFQVLPMIRRENEEIRIFSDYDGYLVPSLGYLDSLPDDKKKIADHNLNIMNNYSVGEIANLGFNGFTVSLESTLQEINATRDNGLEKEAVVYGRYPIMTSEHCVLSQTKYCRKRGIAIKDETKTVFPISVDCKNCRMRILSPSPLNFTKIRDLKADHIRLIHTLETQNKFLKKAEEYLNKDFSGKKMVWTGHFYQSVE